MNNNITEDKCSLEVSKLLWKHGMKTPECLLDKWLNINFIPTHAVAIKWIRENFYLDISTRYISWPHLNEEKWTPYVDTMIKYKKGRKDRESMMIMMANEESQYLATEAALLHTLKNLIP
jgi:hypothetical protein